MIINEPIVITDRYGTLENQVIEAGEGLRGRPMIYVGNTSDVKLKNLELCCNGIAAAGISCWDLETSDFENIHVTLPTIVGLYMVGKTRNVMRVKVEQLRVEARNAIYPQCREAAGVIMDSEDTAVANVCFCRFTDSLFDTQAGVCVDIRDGDNILMFNTHCINFEGYALRIDKRADNYIVGFEPHLGKVWMRDPERNKVIGWSEANGGKPWPEGYL